MTHGDGQRTTHSSRRAFLRATGAAGAIGLAGLSTSAAAQTTTLNVLTWEEFDAPEFREPIEEKLDVRLDITKSTSSAKMFSSWNAGQYEQYDIAVPNNNYVPKMMDADLLAPVDTDVMTHWDSMYDTFREFANTQFGDGDNVYGVPIRFGWYGYGYDTREVPEHEPSYKILFEDGYVDADLDGGIIMYDNHFKTMGATALYLGYDDAFEGQRVELTEDQLQEVKQTLIDQKPRLQGYIAADPTYIQEFRQGNFLVGHSGRNEIVEMWAEGDDWLNEYISPANGAQLGKVGFSPSVNPETSEHLTEDENELYGALEPERLEDFIPFKAVENEEAWIEAWEDVKTA
ncbi:spermidine/putrescine ABC transporter substrate-binding protein [Halobacteriales archaeon QS_1_67_19]|nr:MAG: spermidine/putrescine ABC transporter substrate-binding protein [Halobacteriales archaeon QS_1_67_19]